MEAATVANSSKDGPAEKLLGYGPQGFALEVSPWLTKGCIERTLLYRGAIVAGWANVETSLIELAIRASRHPSYSDVKDQYPKKLTSRISYLRAVLDAPGPLKPYSSLGHQILDRFARSEGLRNLLAHGRMTLLPGWGATFHFFRARNGSEIIYRIERLTEERLERFARQATRFSRAVRGIVARIDAQELLPPLTVAESPSPEP